LFILFVMNKMINQIKIQKWLCKLQLLPPPAAASFHLRPPPLPSPAAAAAETFRACSAGSLADHFARTSSPCNYFNALKIEQQNDMVHSLDVEEADALVASS
jgi:hypothetical protein